MRVLILGSGLMGPAAAFNALSDPNVSEIVIADRSQQQLEVGMGALVGLEGGGKVSTALLDLHDQAAAARLMADFDVAVGALPGAAAELAIQAALRAGTPLVDMTRLDRAELPELARQAEELDGLIILGCGVEPGLTEILARYLAEKLDRVDELHIKCGGIPDKPEPPLGYKIVFGGRQLPLSERDAFVVRDGQLESVPRYSGVEPVDVPGVGKCEAWHEGFMPWLLDLPALENLRVGTQKTVRWPGYAAKVALLKEMGLLSQEPVIVDGAEVVPKHLLDALLYPHVKMEEGDRDITVFRVEVLGEKDGQRRELRADMVDRYDEVLGFSSMARTTAFTAAIVARMIARGDLRATGILPPEQVVSGPLYDRLVDELAAANIHFVFADV